MLTTLATPAEHRAFHAAAANAYTHAVPAAPDTTMALAAQMAADTHRVMSALWGKATAAIDPDATFFSLASTVTAQATAVPINPAAPAADQVATWRKHWSAALSSANVPLVFPTSVLRATDPPGWARARAEHLHDMSAGDFVAARLAQRTHLSPALGVLAGADAYLVALAETTGDTDLVGVHPRWVRLTESITPDMTYTQARERAAAVLGPVETIRAEPYLDPAQTPESD